MTAALLSSAGAAPAAELPPPVPGEVDFEREIRPLLESRCYDCHGEDKQKHGLRLDTTPGILKGSDSGEPVFVRGRSADSLIIKRVTAENPKEVMPPKGERLTAGQVGLLRAWIDSGAKMPGDEAAAASLKLTTDHWSFQPVKRPDVPQSGDAFARSEIDEFVLAKLKEKGLSPSSPANRHTLIRRLYLVMHGLPPTPREVEAFVDDRRPDAWERLVDHVIESPRRGERWARHWMDVVRYADTNGFETNRERKTAYHYRDYIVEAFNSDKPYDQFIREQIAGDALGADAATGFLVAGTYDIVKSSDINLTLMQRQEELADMVNTTGTAFMGLTMGCARCHNHKFDPILQKDYYAVQAVFAGVNHGERPVRRRVDESTARELAALKADEAARRTALESLRQRAGGATLTGAVKTLRAAVNPRVNEEVFTPIEALAVRFTISATSSSEPCLDELEIYDASGRNVALASAGAKPAASGTIQGYPIHRLEHLNDGRLGNDYSWISNAAGNGWVEISFPEKARIQRVIWGRDRMEKFRDRVATQYKIEAATEPGKWVAVAGSDDREPFHGAEDPDAFLTKLSPDDAAAARKLQSDLADLTGRIAKLTGTGTGWIGTFSQPQKTHRLYRGEPMQKREVVAPDALSVLGTLGLSVEEPEQQRRVKLANWIASRQHPLTARVMVNRLWHYTFGTGIVDTPGDFGKNGSRPTHPELLDWLADEFVKSGWSVKHVQRLLLLSAAFQQSSAPRTDALAADADGRFLWRFPPRRLEAEAIRDSMLAVSGSLDLRMGGPGFYLMDVVEENVMHYFPKEKFSPAEFRRMVYQFRIRQTSDSVFSSFDCPDGGQVMPRRSRSNTPLQALNLFNSSFVLQQSDFLAARLRKEAGDSPEAQAEKAFVLFYARPPDPWEREQSAAMIRAQGLPSFGRALYNTSEFLFVF
jgi:Protein of unknown function (DUF1553)/Protein of unknown function (DUF1549)/Planctomycete cytochrome C